MKYTFLSTKGLRISELALGAMTFGGATEFWLSDEYIAGADYAGVDNLGESLTEAREGVL